MGLQEQLDQTLVQHVLQTGIQDFFGGAIIPPFLAEEAARYLAQCLLEAQQMRGSRPRLIILDELRAENEVRAEVSGE